MVLYVVKSIEARSSSVSRLRLPEVGSLAHLVIKVVGLVTICGAKAEEPNEGERDREKMKKRKR